MHWEAALGGKTGMTLFANAFKLVPQLGAPDEVGTQKPVKLLCFESKRLKLQSCLHPKTGSNLKNKILIYMKFI